MTINIPSDLLPTIAVIPARAGSKGLPGKNLLKLGGKTLIERAVRCAELTGIFSQIIVSSDSEYFLTEARRVGARPIERPAKLADDDSNIVDTIIHVLDVLANEDGWPSSVVLLEPSCPLRKPEMVKDTFLALINNDSAFTVTELDLKLHAAKQFTLLKNDIAQRVCSNLASPVNRQELSATVVRNGAAYAFRTETFLKSRSILSQNPRAVLLKDYLVNIDTLQDFILAEKFLAGEIQDISS